MELVPWVYNNPRLNVAALEKRQFLFHGALVEIIQDVEADIDATKNTALKLWDGAYYLSKYLEHVNTVEVGFWRNKRVIELGAGCGLVGIVAWLLGANVTLTDLDEAADHTRRCVDENVKRLAAKDDSDTSLRIANIRTDAYSWGDDISDLGVPPPFDVILGSDIVYRPDTSGHLLSALKQLCAPQSQVFISYKPRGLGEERFFTDIEVDFDCADVEFNPPDFLNSDYKIYKICRKL